MSRTCTRIRKVLAADGPAALRYERRAQEHLVACSGCYAFLEALAELESALAELPGVDAPDDTVERLLALPELRESAGPANAQAEESETAEAPAPAQSWPVPQLPRLLASLGAWLPRGRRLVLALGVPAALLVMVSLVTVTTLHRSHLDARSESASQPQAVTYETAAPQEELEQEKDQRARVMREVKGLRQEPAESNATAGAGFAAGEVAGADQDSGVVVDEVQLNERLDQGIVAGIAGEKKAKAQSKPAAPLPVARKPVESLMASGFLQPGPAEPVEEEQPIPDLGSFDLSNTQVVAPEVGNLAGGVMRDSTDGKDELAKHRSNLRGEEAAAEDGAAAGTSFRRGGGRSDPTTTASRLDYPVDLQAARRFLAERESINGVLFQEPRGYWANTYVPGDRQLRQLQTRLQGWDRSGLPGAAGVLGLHERSRRVVQPFDSPEDAALGVFLHADHRGLAARSRLLLQVGVRGTARRAGRRGAMNVGLVLDLRRSPAVETSAAIRALVEAFARAQDLGDRFSLTVAGRTGGQIVPPGDFRYGPLLVAMAELLGEESPGEASAGEVLSLSEALAQAVETVSAADDPTTPLGSSVVVLVTAQPLAAADEAALVAQAHRSAVDGVPLSVIGIGSRVQLDQLDRLVLAGQGNRRLLSSPAEAEGLVDRELAAVSRIIARAVRLRIRLAPGVQLIDMLGSHRLDEVRAQQVRDAEASIDRRLSHNLGIEADRGLDEEGIQIVIPSFYAADAHVILLDLVAPGAGPVADVTVRYKDLVFLRNGVARDHLSLGRSQAPPGPLERNVLKNLLAHELGVILSQAAAALAGGNPGEALRLLGQFRSLLITLPQELPDLEHDPDLAGDLALVEEYLQVLLAGMGEEDRSFLVDSLRFAGRLKVVRVLETQ